MRMHRPVTRQAGGSQLIMRKKCACGRPLGPTGECTACRRKARPQAAIQLAGALGSQPGSPEERPDAFDQSNRKSSPAEEGIRFFSRRKTACLSPEGLQVTMGTDRNNDTAATGKMTISYKGVGRTRWREDQNEAPRLFARGERIKSAAGKTCDCDCLMYRQFIRGVALGRPPGQERFASEGKITSGMHTEEFQKQLSAAEWLDEDISTICKGRQHGCEREACVDTPGIQAIDVPGTDVFLRYHFLLQIWDRCQEKPAAERKQTLTISGSADPRDIQWSDGWLPLQNAPAAGKADQDSQAAFDG